MAYLSRPACAALLAGVMGVMATTDAGFAAPPSITLASSGGGAYDYDLFAGSGVTFSPDQTITLSGLSGVTDASVISGSDLYNDGFTLSSFTSTEVVFEAPPTMFTIHGSTTSGTLEVDSSVLTTGTVDYSIDTTVFGTGGTSTFTFSGTVDGPVGAAVPEPATWAMALLGFAGLGFAAHRRAKLKGPVGFSAA
jgi:hypothetical protein